MTSLVEQIRTNQLTALQLDRKLQQPEELAGPELFPSLLAALRDNVSIRMVGLSDIFCQKLSFEAFQSLLDALISLPRLQHVRVFAASHAVPVAKLTRLFCRQGLESVNITYGTLITTNRDILVLANSLRDHPSLKELDLLPFGREDDDEVGDQQASLFRLHGNESTKLDINPLIASLATLPRLESLELTLSEPLARVCARIDERQLYRLVKQPALQGLTLWECGLEDCHMSMICDAIHLHPNLQFLSLRHNDGITKQGWREMIRTLESQYTLTSVYGCPDDAIRWEMCFLLRMNLYGRGCLLGPDGTDDLSVWIEALKDVDEDTGMTYYLLRQMPHLLSQLLS